jgi:hypothetical protein
MLNLHSLSPGRTENHVDYDMEFRGRVRNPTLLVLSFLQFEFRISIFGFRIFLIIAEGWIKIIFYSQLISHSLVSVLQ